MSDWHGTEGMSQLNVGPMLWLSPLTSPMTLSFSAWNYIKNCAVHQACAGVAKPNSMLLIKWQHLNRHQTILHTFLNFFLNLTLSGVPHLYKQLPNGQHLSDLCKMCNLEANLWKGWIGDHRILTYIFKWVRLNTAGHSHPVSIGHWVAPLYND